MTGTAAEITPVRSVDRKQVGAGRPGDVTRALQKAFFGLFDGTTTDQWGWLTPVSDVVVPDHEDQKAAVHGRTPQQQPASMGAVA